MGVSRPLTYRRAVALIEESQTLDELAKNWRAAGFWHHPDKGGKGPQFALLQELMLERKHELQLEGDSIADDEDKEASGPASGASGESSATEDVASIRSDSPGSITSAEAEQYGRAGGGTFLAILDESPSTLGNACATPVDVISLTLHNANQSAKGEATHLPAHTNPHNKGILTPVAPINEYSRLHQSDCAVALSDSEQEFAIVIRDSPTPHYYLFHPGAELLLHVKPPREYCAEEMSVSGGAPFEHPKKDESAAAAVCRHV
ncbi:unnamed protein product, partial [Amoebophrya sp. A25]|eukprot:GSA25T00026551001.1